MQSSHEPPSGSDDEATTGYIELFLQRLRELTLSSSANIWRVLQLVSDSMRRNLISDPRNRLTSTELKLCLLHLAAQYNSAINVDEGKVNSCYRVVAQGKTFVVCPMVKDAETASNEAYLPFILDACREYKKFDGSADAIFLIPLLQCRGLANVPIDLQVGEYRSLQFMQRMHAVLLEVNLEMAEIRLHDPQRHSAIYPDKISEVMPSLCDIFQASLRYMPHHYGTQADINTCGEHVILYVGSIFEHGNSAHFSTIKIDPLLFPGKYAFATQACGATLYDASRSSTASSEASAESLVEFDFDKEERSKPSSRPTRISISPRAGLLFSSYAPKLKKPQSLSDDIGRPDWRKVLL